MLSFAGQDSSRDLYDVLNSRIDNVHVIGGAFELRELDAKSGDFPSLPSGFSKFDIWLVFKYYH